MGYGYLQFLIDGKIGLIRANYKYISKKVPTFREEMNCEMFILLEIFKIVYETPL